MSPGSWGRRPAPEQWRDWGRAADWRHPRRDGLGRVAEAVARSRVVDALAAWLPAPPVRTDVRDAFYLNALVEAPRLASLVPPGLVLDTLGPGGCRALLTLLVFRNRHLGPPLPGPLRRVLPSPLQANLRVHVRDAAGRSGVYFLSTAVEGTLLALVARAVSILTPMHVLAAAELVRRDDAWRVRLDPGAGSAPDLDATLGPRPDRGLAPPWDTCFADFEAVVAHCVPQRRALGWDRHRRRVARLAVRIDAPLQECEPVAGPVTSATLRQLAGGDPALLCFRVPHLLVRTLGFRRDPP